MHLRAKVHKIKCETNQKNQKAGLKRRHYKAFKTEWKCMPILNFSAFHFRFWCRVLLVCLIQCHFTDTVRTEIRIAVCKWNQYSGIKFEFASFSLRVKWYRCTISVLFHGVKHNIEFFLISSGRFSSLIRFRVIQNFNFIEGMGEERWRME